MPCLVADECWGSAGPHSGPLSCARIIFVDRLAGVNGPEWELNNWGSLTPGHLARATLSTAVTRSLSQSCTGSNLAVPRGTVRLLQYRFHALKADVSERMFPVLLCCHALSELSPGLVPPGLISGQGEALAGKWLNHRVSVVETAASRWFSAPLGPRTQTAGP